MAQKRSPILGYNHNFRHHGRVFHVQTEDSGVDNPHVFTHLFHGGVIISSRKLDYDSASSEEAVKSLMQAQHKRMLRDLKTGSFDAKIVQYLGPHPDGTEVPEEALEEPLTPPPAVAPPPPPSAAPQLLEAEDISVNVQFHAPRAVDVGAEKSEPIEIHQPPPVEQPVPSGASRYIQRGGREAPLVNTGQHEALDPSGPPPPRTPEHVDDGPTTPTPVAQGKRRRASQPPPIPAAARRRPTRPPSRPPSQGYVRRPQPPTIRPPARPPSSSSVVVSRPAVIVGAPPKTVGDSPSRSRRPTPGNRAPAAPAPPASRPAGKPRARSARETSGTNPGSLFGRDLISEKSLDEVILAYLSEDTED